MLQVEMHVSSQQMATNQRLFCSIYTESNLQLLYIIQVLVNSLQILVLYQWSHGAHSVFIHQGVAGPCHWGKSLGGQSLPTEQIWGNRRLLAHSANTPPPSVEPSIHTKKPSACLNQGSNQGTVKPERSILGIQSFFLSFKGL